MKVGSLTFSFEDHGPKFCFQTLEGIGYVRVSVDDTGEHREETSNSLPRSLPNEHIEMKRAVPDGTGLLLVHPAHLTFDYERNKATPCLLHLINTSHQSVEFRWQPDQKFQPCFDVMSGTLPPDSTSTYLTRVAPEERFKEVPLRATIYGLDSDHITVEVTQRTWDNCFGEVVDDSKLNQLERYTDKPKTQEDRAREAWRLVTDGDRKGRASGFVDLLKRLAGNGPSTLCLLYNATGDTIHRVAAKDWYGGHICRAGYPAEIGNGQWAAFHHVHSAVLSSSVGAVVYRGKNNDGQNRDYLFSWSTPWGF